MFHITIHITQYTIVSLSLYCTVPPKQNTLKVQSRSCGCQLMCQSMYWTVFGPPLSLCFPWRRDEVQVRVGRGCGVMGRRWTLGEGWVVLCRGGGRREQEKGREGRGKHVGRRVVAARIPGEKSDWVRPV